MPPVDRPPETAEARKARQFASLRTIGECALDLATDAHAAAKQQLAPADNPATNDPRDYAATFATMARAVRQTIAIEMRLDAPARTRPAFRPPPLPDPRRSLLRHAFHQALAGEPDRARRRREADDMIEHQLAADPDALTPIKQIVEALSVGLCVELDVARLPDALIGMPPRHRPDARASPFR